MAEAPSWFTIAVLELAGIFALGDWAIDTVAKKYPGGHEYKAADGAASFNTWYKTATIAVKKGQQFDEFGMEIAVHEVLHLVVSEVRDLFAHYLDDDEKAMEAYDRVEERLLTTLCRGLVGNFDILGRIERLMEDAAKAQEGHEAPQGDEASLPDAAGRDRPPGGNPPGASEESVAYWPV